MLGWPISGSRKAEGCVWLLWLQPSELPQRPIKCQGFLKSWRCWSISGKISWIKWVSSDKPLIWDRVRPISNHRAKVEKCLEEKQLMKCLQQHLPSWRSANLRGSVWGWQAVETGLVSCPWGLPPSDVDAVTPVGAKVKSEPCFWSSTGTAGSSGTPSTGTA